MITKLPKHSLPLAVILGRKTTSALAPETRAIRDGADVLASFGTVRGLVKKTDMGALKNGQRRIQIDETHVCPEEDSVLYLNGNPYLDGIRISPEEGCNGMCCVGIDDNGRKACDFFTGCVKKDGSCTGTDACYYAYAPGGIKGSCVGDKACMQAQLMDADMQIINSCNADESCDDLGFDYRGLEGTVGTVDSSCNAKGACKYVGLYATIKSIVGSCNSEKHKSCLPLRGTWEKSLEFGDITHSKRDFRVKKTRAKDISACIALCEERDADPRDACKGIKWRQGVQKPCRIFKGGFSEGKCHDKDLCIDL